MTSHELRLTPTALRDLHKLPRAIQRRIGQKLNYFRSQENPMDFAVPLMGASTAGQYRFRVGDYRIIFDVVDRTILILMIEHRREVYRRR